MLGLDLVLATLYLSLQLVLCKMIRIGGNKNAIFSVAGLKPS